jgi:myosin heavy chain 6/7
MGEMSKSFVGMGKEEQADIKPEDQKHASNVSTLLGIDCEWMINYFCKPKLKVGAEWVTKGQTVSQASSSVAGIARSLYERTFKFIVDKCNETLVDETMKRVQFIGVLDIAGFEIFDYNGFEQICINFCNEKLQQFFNHHMFVLEQEEYMREGIEWAMVDFGMDLQKCIEMFEKPMGLLAILEEESLFPKATDQSFAAKLHANLLGKCPNFAKPDPKPDPEAHFAIAHYAAKVSYNLTSWLEKNKDPLNDTIVEMMKNGTNALVVLCFADHPGQPAETPKDQGGSKKKGGGKTVSSFYKAQLDDLMKTLHATEPHFIRCVVPNTHKQPGGIESALIMHQLTCNGVLEGIRICRKGFPNRMNYPDFKSRYNILAAAAVAKAKNDKGAASSVLEAVGLEKEKYRLGHTKVFFRAGVLGQMEEIREDRVGQVLSWLQAFCRGKQARMNFKRMQDQKLSLYCCQRTIRNYMIGKTWLWWQIWVTLKPNLKCTKFAQYKAEYEEKLSVAEANIGKAIEECNKVKVAHQKLEEEKREVLTNLSSGGNVVKEMATKIERLEKSKTDLEKQVDQLGSKIRAEEDLKRASEQSGGKLRKDMDKMKDEILEAQQSIEKSEDDIITKENQIRTLREELAHQEELIQKLGREKKSAGDSRQKTEEAIQAAEDRCNHLNKLKLKLEQNLDECEDSLEREKKSRMDADKLKKKVEADLKLTQETVADLERLKEELNQTIQRKEKELASVSAKIEDEQTLGGKYSKQIKELQTRIEELEEELAIERQNRNKAEKNRVTLSRDIEDLGEKLEDAGNNTTTQIELNKKREAELLKLKNEMEESNIAFEGTLAGTRSKHNAVISEMGSQIDDLNKGKAKAEADKAKLERDLHEAKSSLDAAIRERQNVEKEGKLAQSRITEANQKLDELARALNEADSSKKKLTVEGQDLQRQTDDAETHIADLGKAKISLTTQLEDTKRLADAESRDRAALLSKFKNLNSELENLRERIEEEAEQKGEILKQLSKAQAEILLWKSKYETEGLSRIDELEGNKTKLQMRLQEAEETIESLQSKVASTEKTKHRLDTELEDLQLEYERVNAAAIVAEKRAQNFDKVVGEWKLKVDDLINELEASQRECRNYNSEVFRLRAGWEEINEQLDAVKRENKNLAEEIKDLLDQLGEGGRSIHELDKQRRRLEIEKEELQAALEEAEAALEQEENKVMRAQLELTQVRQEIDRRMQEKEEEFENTR